MQTATKVRLLTVPEAVELFPVPPTPASIYRWCRIGALKCVRVGARVYISPEAVQEFLARGFTDDGDGD